MFPEKLAPPGCVKIFLDTDPGYNQIMLTERFSWSENVERWCRLSRSARPAFYLRQEISMVADCIIPKAGFGWKTHAHANRARPVVTKLRCPSHHRQRTLDYGDDLGRVQGRAGLPKGIGGPEQRERIRKDPRSATARGVSAPGGAALGGRNAPLERLARHPAGALWMARRRRSRPKRYRDFIAPAREGSFRPPSTCMSPRAAVCSVAARPAISRLEGPRLCRTPVSAA